MKKLKNTWKRFGAVACAFALTVTLAFPINSYAENETVETESVETMLTETEETAIPVEAQAEDGLKTSRMITIEAVGYYVDDSGNEKTASCNFPMQMEEEKTTYGEVRQQVVNTLNNWVQTEGSTVDCFGGMKIQNWNIKPYYQIGNPDFSDDTIIALWTLPDRIRVDAEASYDKWLLTYLVEVFNDEGKFYEEFYETVEKSEAGTAIRVTEKYADQMEYAGDKGWKDMKSGNIYQPGDTLAIQKNTGLKLSLEYEGTFNPIGRDETAPGEGEQQPDESEPDTTVPQYEVVLSEGNSSVSKETMQTYVEKNKTQDVVIRTANGVVFTFAKGEMKLVDGKESYTFSTKLITDFAQAGKTGFAKDEFVFRISYDYSGALPGIAKISIPLGKNWVGKKLYYYEVFENGTSKYLTNAVVDGNGVFTITQNHCSDYVGTTKAPNPNVSEGGDPAPKTSDTLPIMPGAVMMVLALGMITASGVKLKKNK